MIITFQCPYSCVIHSSWVWGGPGDSLLRNRIWQVLGCHFQGYMMEKIWLFHWVLSLALSWIIKPGGSQLQFCGQKPSLDNNHMNLKVGVQHLSAARFHPAKTLSQEIKLDYDKNSDQLWDNKVFFALSSCIWSGLLCSNM